MYTSNIPMAIYLSIVERYPRLRYIRSAKAFANAFLGMHYKNFLSEEVLARFRMLAVGVSWDESANPPSSPTLEEVIGAFK